MVTSLVHKHTAWNLGNDLEDVLVTYEAAYTTLEYCDSGVGEHYVVKALQAEYPSHRVEVDEWGGCESCGFGRTVSITVHGKCPWG